MITQPYSPSGLYSTSMHLNKCYESRTAFHLHTLKDSSKRDLRKGSLWASLVLMITFCYTNDLRYFFWKNVCYLLSQVKIALQRVWLFYWRFFWLNFFSLDFGHFDGQGQKWLVFVELQYKGFREKPWVESKVERDAKVNADPLFHQCFGKSFM